jgi:hypothetical protein
MDPSEKAMDMLPDPEYPKRVHIFDMTSHPLAAPKQICDTFGE